jgi:ubiquitin C-terminal hydrolase
MASSALSSASSGAGARPLVELINPLLNGASSPRQRDGAGAPGHLNERVRIFSPDKRAPPPTPSQSILDTTMDRTEEDIPEALGKTNHYAGLCFGAAIVFIGLSFHDGYRLLGERTFSLLLRGTFWAVVATVIGTAGEILQKTTRIETPIVPSTIYQTPMTLKEGQFPGMPNMGYTCFINAPTQAIMNDSIYPRVYKAICERAKARHTSFKNFLELYPAQSGILSSFAWPKFLSRKREVEPPLAVVNMRDVLVMLMKRRSRLNYDSPEFVRQYPNIHRLIGEFSTVTREDEFPAVADDNLELRQEFTLMKNDQTIMRFFDQERPRIANEILGFDAYLSLIHAYETAVEQKLTTVSFGRWVSAPIGNIRHLIQGAAGDSQEDVEEFLHCLSKYVLPNDYPEVFFPLAYERKWEECPEAEQDPIKLQELLALHQNPRTRDDVLTQIPDTKKIVERPTLECILKIKTLLRPGVDGQVFLNETFETKRAATGPDDPRKETFYYLNSLGAVRKYYLVEERVVPPAAERMPERIILELLRYKWVNAEHGRQREKIECSVSLPERIQICGHNYRLKSIVLHSGTPERGHNYTIVSKQGQCWFASDTTVDTAEQAHVDQAAIDGYLYFYEKTIGRLNLEEAM